MYTSRHTDRTHLSQEDRAVIEVLRNSGATFRAIAHVIHKHYSTKSNTSRRTSALLFTNCSSKFQCLVLLIKHPYK